MIFFFCIFLSDQQQAHKIPAAFLIYRRYQLRKKSEIWSFLKRPGSNVCVKVLVDCVKHAYFVIRFAIAGYEIPDEDVVRE